MSGASMNHRCEIVARLLRGVYAKCDCGWRSSRFVTRNAALDEAICHADSKFVHSEEKLHALPHGSVVRGTHGGVWEKEIHNGFHYWYQAGESSANAGDPNIPLPAVLLWNPNDDEAMQ